MGGNDYLVDGEKLIYTVEGNNARLYLTDKRLISVKKVGFISINVKFKDVGYNHISSIERVTFPNPLYMGVSLSLFIVGTTLIYLNMIMNTESILPFIIIALGLIFAYLYIISKHAGIRFVTESEKIPFEFLSKNAESKVKKITEIIRQNR